MTEDSTTPSDNSNAPSINAEEDAQPAIRPLHLHTVDTILNDLVGGYSIGVGESNTEYSIEGEHARSILNWYMHNRNLWTKQLNATVAMQVANASQATLPSLSQTPNTTQQVDKKQYTLLSIKAFRFSGLHNHGSISNEPPEFYYEPHPKTSLLEGRNGSGKTSILNAIIWALTGQLIRPQRKPESAKDTFECEGVNGSDLVTAKITPITPIPTDINNLILNTWVELTFEDTKTKEKHVIKRHSYLEGRSKKEDVTGADGLNLDPVAFYTGTVMPNLLPYIQLGSKSDLGLEVAKLTGLASLVDLSKHAYKARTNWLPKRIKPKLEDEIQQLDKSYNRELTDLLGKITSNSALKLETDIPHPSSALGIEDIIKNAQTHYENMKSQSLNQAKSYLGEKFDPSDKAQGRDLESNIGGAINELKQIQRMPSASHLAALGQLTHTDIDAAELMISTTLAEAETLIELTKNPDRSTRLRLFALVSEWLADHSHHSPEDNCPVCTQTIAGRIDAITGRTISSHLSDTSIDAALISQTITKWAASKITLIDANIADSLRDEIALTENSSPYDLIRKALTDELFLTDPFKRSLSSLKENVHQLCNDNQHLLPTLEYGPTPEFSEKHDALLLLQNKLNRLQNALELAKWRKNNIGAISSFWGAVIGFEAAAPNVTTDTSLRSILTKLKVIVESSQPINDALICCERLIKDLKGRRLLESEIKHIDQAIAALIEVEKLGDLAQLQVDTLQNMLKEETEKWRTRIYKAAFPSTVVSIASTALSNAGELNISVDKEGVKAPIEHISNASALRASIFAFFLAFWFHVLKEHGGLRLLLLDDPQELLDNENRDNLAQAIPEMVDAGGQLIITSYDIPFSKSCANVMRKKTGLDHKSIHPISRNKDVITLSPSILDVQRLRKICEGDANNEGAAQDYASEVRVYLECCLGDFFNNSIHPASAETTTSLPTLFTFIDKIKGRIPDTTNELYKGRNLRSLVSNSAFSEGNPTRSLLGKAHHQDKRTITANEVYERRDDLKKIMELASLTHEDFRSWAKREPLPPTVNNKIINLTPISVANMNVELYPDIAAMSSIGDGLGSQDIETETLNESWFTDRSFYYLRSDNFGFSAPKNSVAIVDSSSSSVADGRLVIGNVNGAIVARRILKSDQSDYIALASENPDPTKRFDSLIVKRTDALLHQVVGIIFNQQNYSRTSHEAILTTDASMISNITSAFTVKGDSAIPLALNGQVILAGKEILASDLLSNSGSFVAVTTSENQQLFKRIGEQVSSNLPHLMQFESIGGLGKSIILSTDPNDASVPYVCKIQEILGVLYSSSTNLE